MTSISGLSGSIYTYYRAREALNTAASSTSDRATQDGTATTGNSTGQAAKSFADVAADARAALDAGYEKLGETGTIHTTNEQWRKTVGLDDLDRRSLYAIASNEGGLFSEAESGAARIEMSRRAAEVMMKGVLPGGAPNSANYKSVLDYYDQASAEEKESFEWAEARASAEFLYETRIQREGGTAEQVGSNSDVSSLIVEGWRQLAATDDSSKRIEDMSAFRLALEHWSEEFGSRDRIDWTM
jgi:hypothetical protein